MTPKTALPEKLADIVAGFDIENAAAPALDEKDQAALVARTIEKMHELPEVEALMARAEALIKSLS